MKNLRPEPGDRVVDRNDAEGTVVLEKPSGERQRGCFAPAPAGQPLPPQGEYLVYTRDDGVVYDVTELPRPSRANSSAYRTGYDRVFNKAASN